MTRCAYARKVFRRYWQIFARYKNKTREGRGVEPLHRIRTTTRRLRNALWVFRDIFPKKELSRWKKILRQLAQITSAARDLDIQIQFLSRIKQQFSRTEYRPVIENLRRRLQARRQNLQPRIVRALDRATQSQTRGQLKAFLQQSPPSSASEIVHLHQLAKKCIDKRLQKIFHYESYVDRPEAVAELHQLRIAAKHLRYTLENFEGLYGKFLTPFTESVRLIQSALGGLHDYDVWIATLPKYRRKSSARPIWNEAIDQLREECKKSRQETYWRFHQLWRDLKRDKIWERLVKGLE